MIATVNSSDSGSEGTPVYDISTVGSTRSVQKEPIWVTPKINGIPIKMELDTGSAISIIPRNLYTKHFQNVKLKPSKILLRSYLNELKPTEDSLSLNVQHGTSS